MVKSADRTVGRSFRIKERWLDVLKKEAEREGISPNALLNKILQQYSVVYRNSERYDVIVMPNDGFIAIIDSLPEERIKEIAKLVGSTITLDTFRSWGIPRNLDSLKEFIRNTLSEYAGWFKYDHHIVKGKEMFHFRHNLGHKWSIFIAEEISTTFDYLLNIKATPDILPGSVTITIEKEHLQFQ